MTKKEVIQAQRREQLAAIAEYIKSRGQATSVDVALYIDASPCTVSRHLRILCLTGAIHQITKYSGRAGGHAVYGPGPAILDADGETVDEWVTLRQNSWPDGHAHRDPMVAALFGAPLAATSKPSAVSIFTESAPCAAFAPRIRTLETA